jgi:hypothetical protein
MGFLVLLLVGVATTVLAISAATGILHVLFQLMDASALPPRAVAGDAAAGGSAEPVFRP